MLFLEYNSAPLALCLAPPNWAQPIKIEIQAPVTDVTTALSRKETRSAFGVSARYSLEYTIDTADARQSTDLRLWLNRLRTEQLVAVPMWTDGVELSSPVNAGATVLAKTTINPVQSGAEWIILSAGASVYELVVVSGLTSGAITLAGSGATLNWPAGTMMFPLLFGRLLERPKFTADTDELASGTIKFGENSPYARRLNPYPGEIPVVGPGVPGFSGALLWDIQPDHTELIDHTELEALYSAIGLGREEQSFAHQQFVRRGVQMTFLQGDREGIAKVTRMFVNRRGPALNFMVPDFRGNLRLTQSVPVAGDPTRLPIEASRYTDSNYATEPGHAYIALVDPFSVDPQHVATIDGTGVHLSSAIALFHDASSTKVSALLLARFAETELTWSYDTDGIATARIKFIEVPDEYSLGAAANPPERAKLYKFTEFVDVPVVRGYYTSYEQALTWSGSVWQPAPFGHKALTGDTKLGDKVDLETWDFSQIAGVIAANPVRRILDGTLEGIMWCDIVEVNALAPDDASAFIEIAGEVVKLDTTGKEWKCSLDPFGRFLDGPLPRFYRQKVCNVPLFSPKCAYGRPTMREDFKSVGTIVAKTPTSVDLAPVAGQPDPTAKAADYFAGGGWLEGGTGLTFERRTIKRSEVIGGNLRLTFGRALLWPAIGDTLRLWPGCNGSIETCQNVFDNRSNGRMHPQIPVKNPSANIGEMQQSSGGKKG